MSVHSKTIEDYLEKTGDQELKQAFKAMVGCDGEQLFNSLNPEMNHYNKSDNHYFQYRQILLNKKAIVMDIADQLSIDEVPLYDSLLTSREYWHKYRCKFFKLLDGFLASTNQKLDIYETNPPSAIYNAFDYWLSNFDIQMDFIKYLEIWLERNRNNQMYFSSGYDRGKLLKYEYVIDVCENFEQDNIVKFTCKKLDLSYKELAEAIGVKEQSLRNSISNGKITLQIEKSLNLLIENHSLKEQLEDCHTFREALINFTKKV